MEASSIRDKKILSLNNLVLREDIVALQATNLIYTLRHYPVK